MVQVYVGGGVRHLQLQFPTNLACVSLESRPQVLEVLSGTKSLVTILIVEAMVREMVVSRR